MLQYFQNTNTYCLLANRSYLLKDTWQNTIAIWIWLKTKLVSVFFNKRFCFHSNTYLDRQLSIANWIFVPGIVKVCCFHSVKFVDRQLSIANCIFVPGIVKVCCFHSDKYVDRQLSIANWIFVPGIVKVSYFVWTSIVLYIHVVQFLLVFSVYKHRPDKFIARTVELWTRWIKQSCYYNRV